MDDSLAEIICGAAELPYGTIIIMRLPEFGESEEDKKEDKKEAKKEAKKKGNIYDQFDYDLVTSASGGAGGGSQDAILMDNPSQS